MADDVVSQIFAFSSEAPSSTEVADPPETSVDTEVDTPDVSADGAEGDGESADVESDVESQAEGDKDGGKPKPLSLSAQQAALTKLRNESTDPETQAALRMAKDAIARADVYAKLGKVEEIRVMKTAVDSAGGLQGIADLQAISSSIEQTDAFVSNGDPQVLDQILEDSPEGAPKLLAPFLNKIEKLKPEIYDNAIQPHLVKNLIAAGFENVLSQIANATTIEGAKKSAMDLAQWFANQKALAQKNGSAEIDPREAALSKREQALATTETTRYHGEVGTAIRSHTDTTFGAELKPYDLSKLTARMKTDIANSLYIEMGKLIKADKAGSLQMKSLLGKAANKDKAIAHGNAAVSRYAAQVTKKVMADYGLKPGKPKTAPVVRTTETEKKVVTPVNGKIVRVSEKPDRSLWDMSATTTDMIVRGEAILKKNKVHVKWR